MNKLENVKMMMLAMQRYPWEQGVCSQAFLESGDEDVTIRLVCEAVHRQIDDGRLSMVGAQGAVTDPVAAGEALLFAIRKTGDKQFTKALELLNKWVNELAPRNSEGTMYHNTPKPEFWVDSFYMLPPYLAAAGQFEEALRQINGLWKALFLPEKNLLAHIYDDEEKTFKREDVWGVGNGWAISGMTRVLARLPQSMETERKQLIEKIKTILDAILALQREDGLFHDVLDDPASFVDTNVAQMTAYTIYRGVEDGWLDASYLTQADRIREAAYKKVSEYGVVQEVCGAPNFDHSGSAVEGQAFFVLMEAAYEKKKWPSV